MLFQKIFFGRVNKMVKKRTVAALFIGCVLVVSCAGNVPSVRTLVKQQETEQHAGMSHNPYVIGPGDILAVNIWKEPELSKESAVRLDGKISLPLVNDVKAAGLTCAELRERLIGRYKNYVESPEVSVTMVESRSKKIYVLGKINKPGEYTLQKEMTILQALSLAGGVSEWADRSDIRLVREIEGTEKTFKVDYDAIVSGQDLSQNIQLQPDDTIFLP